MPDENIHKRFLLVYTFGNRERTDEIDNATLEEAKHKAVRILNNKHAELAAHATEGTVVEVKGELFQRIQCFNSKDFFHPPF